jgi:N-acetylmuramic acid 6-phosphate etherase
MKKITESDSLYQHLDRMGSRDIITAMNREDAKVPAAIEKALDAIENLIDCCVPKMKGKGRLFYMGAGTSGRLGIVDASECPPTFGVAHGKVVGIMAGGDAAIRKAVEFAEDDTLQGWKDLQAHNITQEDVVVGIAASGTTPYVIAALESCNKNNIVTACITCNPGSPLASVARYPIVIEVGPEFVTGSTRLKSGTAQKLVLNMLSTAIMIQLGHVKGNKMVDMQLSNDKLIERGTQMIMKETGIEAEQAKALLLKHGSVRKAVDIYRKI